MCNNYVKEEEEKKKIKKQKKEKENKQRMIKNAGETTYFISSSAHGRDNHRFVPRIIHENACLS